MPKLSKSHQIIEKTGKLIGRAQYAGLYGIGLKSGKDNRVTDFDDQVYLDFLAGASAVTVGYGRKEVIEAFTTTANKMTHSCFVYSPNQETLELAEKIIAITPGDFPKKVMFGTSASDSIDGAIKASRKYTQKMGVVSFNNAYHGNTGLSAQATGFPGITNGFLSSSDFYFVDFPKSEDEATLCLTKITEIFKTQEIGCFIIESIQGDGGNIVPPFNFFPSLKKLCEEHKVVFVDDETQSGAGRTGKWWAIEHFGVAPDILVAGKGITGGYVPMSFLVGKSEIIDALDKAQHVFTYSGHPPSCSVTSKVFSIIESDGLLENAQKIGNLLEQELSSICRRYSTKIVSEVRGIGLQMGLLALSTTGEGLAALIGMRCLEKGLYVGYFGPKNEVLRLHPPLTITEQEAKEAVTIIESVFAEYSQGSIPETTISKYNHYCLGLGNGEKH